MTNHNKFATRYGCYLSVLLELEYFDPIRFTATVLMCTPRMRVIYKRLMKSFSSMTLRPQHAVAARAVYRKMHQPVPHETFLHHMQYRVYKRRAETKIFITKTPEQVYYHSHRSCTPTTSRDNIQIAEASDSTQIGRGQRKPSLA